MSDNLSTIETNNKISYNTQYIYIRTNIWYSSLKIVKLGSTTNIPERDDSYKTCEPLKGQFTNVYKINNKSANDVEKLLQEHFKDSHSYNNGGTEFYNEDIISKIPNYFREEKINYTELSEDEINELTRKNREKKTIKYNQDITPYEYQKETIEEVKEYFKNNDIGMIIWACGLGKTILSLLISKIIGFKKILIGVPSISLQNQFHEEILKIYPNIDILFIGGNNEKSTTNYDEINKFINNKKEFIIITTYSSCHLLKDCSFSLKIGDEAHHLTGIKEDEEEKRRYVIFHEIKSDKTLFMTATMKVINNKKVYSTTDKTVYSMDEKEFGGIINERSVKWAIENEKITDYKICIYTNTEEEVNNIIDNLEVDRESKELFMASYMAIEMITKFDRTHILVYCNNVKNADIINKYITDLLKKIPINSIYHNSLHYNTKNLEEEKEKFRIAKYGIISCVYLFGEGYNCPKLDGIVIAENMITKTRIVQSILRPCRINYDSEDPYKEALNGIPYIKTKDNSNYCNILEIIENLKIVDDKVEDKIDIYTVNAKSKEDTKNTDHIDTSYDFKRNDKEMKKFKVALYKSRDNNNFLKKYIRENNIKRYNSNEVLIDTKFELEEFIKDIKDEHYNIDNIKNYFEFCLDSDLQQTMKDKYYSKEEFLKTCGELKYNDYQDYEDNYNNSSKDNNKLPPPKYIDNGFYGMEFNFSKELSKDSVSWDCV